MCGPESNGGGEDVITHEKKITVVAIAERIRLHSDKYLDEQ